MDPQLQDAGRVLPLQRPGQLAFTHATARLSDLAYYMTRCMQREGLRVSSLQLVDRFPASSTSQLCPSLNKNLSVC